MIHLYCVHDRRPSRQSQNRARPRGRQGREPCRAGSKRRESRWLFAHTFSVASDRSSGSLRPMPSRGARKPGQGRVSGEHERAQALVCSACTQNNEVRHVVVKSSWGPDGGNPPSTRQGRSQHRTTREGASGRSPTMQYRTERKRSAVRGVRTWGELANGSEAHIRRTGGRIGDGVGTKFCVLTRGDLSASAWSAVVIEEPTTR